MHVVRSVRQAPAFSLLGVGSLHTRAGVSSRSHWIQLSARPYRQFHVTPVLVMILPRQQRMRGTRAVVCCRMGSRVRVGCCEECPRGSLSAAGLDAVMQRDCKMELLVMLHNYLEFFLDISSCAPYLQWLGLAHVFSRRELMIFRKPSQPSPVAALQGRRGRISAKELYDSRQDETVCTCHQPAVPHPSLCLSSTTRMSTWITAQHACHALITTPWFIQSRSSRVRSHVCDSRSHALSRSLESSMEQLSLFADDQHAFWPAASFASSGVINSPDNKVCNVGTCPLCLGPVTHLSLHPQGDHASFKEKRGSSCGRA